MMNLDVTADVTIPRPSISARAREWAVTVTLAATLLAALASAVTVTGTLVADDAAATPKAYHVLVFVAGALTVLRGRIARPRAELVLYFAVVIGATLITYFVYEPRVAGLKLLIALGTALIGANVARGVGPRVLLRACRLASVVFLALVTAKNAQHVPDFVAYLARPFGHPDVPSLAGGGLNLEATWVALSSFFLIGTASFAPFVLLAAMTSALYASRAGLVVAGMAICAAVAYASARRQSGIAETGGEMAARRWRTIVAVTVAVLALGAGAVVLRAVRDYGATQYVAERFSTIGEEPGSLGRLTLWRGGLRVFAEHPLGVGAGNAVPVLKRVLGVDVPEDNLHNIYLQHAVEVGLPGLAALLALAVMVGRRVVRTRFQDQLLLFVAGYLVVGMIQFTGVDAVFWLVYGLQSGQNGGVDA
jgi:O-antigen ligase